MICLNIFRESQQEIRHVASLMEDQQEIRHIASLMEDAVTPACLRFDDN